MLQLLPLALGRQSCENTLWILLQPLVSVAKMQVLAAVCNSRPTAVPCVGSHVRAERRDLRVDVAAVLFGCEAVLVVSVLQRGAVHRVGRCGELQVQVCLVVQREARALVRRRPWSNQATVLCVTITCCARVGRHVSMVQVVVSGLGTENICSSVAHGVV